MIDVLYVLMSWLIISLVLWVGLPMENRSIGTVACIEVLTVLIWFGVVCFLA